MLSVTMTMTEPTADSLIAESTLTEDGIVKKVLTARYLNLEADTKALLHSEAQHVLAKAGAQPTANGFVINAPDYDTFQRLSDLLLGEIGNSHRKLVAHHKDKHDKKQQGKH